MSKIKPPYCLPNERLYNTDYYNDYFIISLIIMGNQYEKTITERSKASICFDAVVGALK